jgi:hypothetical protein
LSLPVLADPFWQARPGFKRRGGKHSKQKKFSKTFGGKFTAKFCGPQELRPCAHGFGGMLTFTTF